MIKDLSASLVAAAAAINAKSREAFVAEQAAIQAKKIAKMPQQPAPKADPAAVSTAKKMAEAVEGTVPKTPREKELAAKHGNKNLITHGDVMKARGVHREEVEQTNEEKMGHAGKVTMKHVNASNASPQVKAAIKKAAPDIKSYGDRAAALNAAGIKREEVEAVGEGWDDMMRDSKERGAQKGTGKFDVKKTSTGTVYTRKSSTFEDGGKDTDQRKADKKAKTEGFMDMLKRIGKKVADTVVPGDEKLIDNLHKSVHGKNAPNVPKPKLKLAHDYVKEDVEQIDELSKSTLGSYAKQATRDAVISRKIGADFEHQSKRAKSPGMKAASDEISQKYKVKSWKRRDGVDKAVDRLTKEEIECLDVQHEQFGAGKTLGQFSEDFSEVDVMFAEGIKRVSIDDIEMVEETTAIHPSAIHVSPGSNGKYKVHAVGKKFASGIKVGEHLTDTHLDDFSEMGGKIKMVKAPKKD